MVNVDTNVSDISFKLVLPSFLWGVVGTVVGRVVVVVLFVCDGDEIEELIDGIPVGLVDDMVSKQFISGFSFAARGLKANEQRFNHESDAML